MQAALVPRGDARTFLTHFVGSGLDDDRYVVQRYLSQANGDVVPIDADGTKPTGRRRARDRERFARRTAERQAAAAFPAAFMAHDRCACCSKPRGVDVAHTDPMSRFRYM